MHLTGDARCTTHSRKFGNHNFSLAAGDDSSSARLPFWALFGRPKSLKRHARLLYTYDTYTCTYIHTYMCAKVCVHVFVCLFRQNFVDCCNLNSIWKRIYGIYSVQRQTV